MGNRTRTAIQALFDPRALVPFVVATVAIGVGGSAIYDLLVLWMGHDASALGRILVLVVAVLGVAVWLVKRAMVPVRRNPAVNKRSPAKHRGLIFMVGRADAARHAIKYHSPELRRCWLLCSVKTLELANQLRAEHARGDVEFEEPLVVNDLNDPLETYRIVDRIYNELPEGFAPEDVIADFLGLTTHCSIGMGLACLDTARPLEAITTIYDGDLKPIMPGDPIEVLLDYNAIGIGRPSSAEAPAECAQSTDTTAAADPPETDSVST